MGCLGGPVKICRVRSSGGRASDDPSVNMVLNVHRKHKAYYGRAELSDERCGDKLGRG